MKFLHRKNGDRMHKQDAWKKSAYAFVPNQTHFGELCGFADDVVDGGQGFGMHGHKNMEITTILISGEQMHRDDTGSEGFLDTNAIQTMSAGTGIQHSEFNASKTKPFHSFQIWVYPKHLNVEPRYETFAFKPADKLNKVLLAISPDRRNGSVKINQDAFFSVLKLEKEKTIDYVLNLGNNGVYVHCASGEIHIEGYTLADGDALGIYETDKPIVIDAVENAEIIFVEVPMYNGVKLTKW